MDDARPDTKPKTLEELLEASLTDEIITVTAAAPAVEQFQARRTNLKLEICSSGISVTKLRAEWLRSIGLSDEPPSVP